MERPATCGIRSKRPAMYPAVNALIDAHCTAFRSGDLSKLPDYYDTPLGYYADDRLSLFATPEDWINHLSARRAMVQSHCFDTLHGEITALEIPRNGRFRVWITWSHHARHMSAPATASDIYYCRLEHGQICVQLVSCVYTDQVLTAARNAVAV